MDKESWQRLLSQVYRNEDKDAVWREIITVVTSLRNGEECINFEYNHGRTLLHIAVEVGRMDIIPLILERGGRLARKWFTDLDLVSSLFSGFRHKAWQVQINLMHDVLCSGGLFTESAQVDVVLHAVKRGDHQVLSMLQEAGFIIPPSALALAVAKRCPAEVMDILLDSEMDLRSNALFSAIEQNLVTKVERLLGAGADIFATAYPHDSSVLHLAPTAEMVRLLVDAGAELECRDAFGNTPFLTLNPLTMKVLLHAGADIDAQDQKGNTALLRAIHHNDINLLLALIRLGASTVVQDRNGNNALHLAQKNADHLRCFVKFCTQPDSKGNLRQAMCMKNQQGETPLLMALHSNEHVEKIRLLTAIADPDSTDLPDNNGKTALHLALDRDDKAVELLLAAGAKVQARDGKGRTALHLSIEQVSGNTTYTPAWSRHQRHFPLLLRAGKKIPGFLNQPDGLGQTALHYATRLNLVETVQQLIAAGADRTIKDKAGMTPAFYATNGVIKQALLKSKR